MGCWGNDVLACRWHTLRGYLRRLVCVALLQVALMSAVPSVISVLDDSHGAPSAVVTGLQFLYNLTTNAENKVR